MSWNNSSVECPYTFLSCLNWSSFQIFPLGSSHFDFSVIVHFSESLLADWLCFDCVHNSEHDPWPWADQASVVRGCFRCWTSASCVGPLFLFFYSSLPKLIIFLSTLAFVMDLLLTVPTAPWHQRLHIRLLGFILFGCFYFLVSVPTVLLSSSCDRNMAEKREIRMIYFASWFLRALVPLY